MKFKDRTQNCYIHSILELREFMRNPFLARCYTPGSFISFSDTVKKNNNNFKKVTVLTQYLGVNIINNYCNLVKNLF